MAGRYEPRPPETNDHDRIMAIEQMFCDLGNELLGNGQPGRLERMDAKIEAHKRESDEQIATINRRIWFWAGGLSAIGAVGTYIVSIVLKH